MCTRSDAAPAVFGIAVGCAVMSFEPAGGIKATIKVNTRGRRHVPTHARWKISDFFDRVLAEGRFSFCPSKDEAQITKDINLDRSVLTHDPFELWWEVKVLDDHNNVLATAKV